MNGRNPFTPPAQTAVRRAANAGASPLPPRWAMEWAGPIATPNAAGCVVRRSRHFTLLTIKMPGTDATDGAALEELTAAAYRRVLATLVEDAHAHPVRIWNFVPRILEGGGNNMDRYMRFNAGRYRAFADFFGGAENFDKNVPAASAVGHGGPDLVIHALAAPTQGKAVANPRQIQPHRYSRRFGPLPPCFARATRIGPIDGTRYLLIGGTASIRGEDSVHPDDLASQLSETAENLSALIAAGFDVPTATAPDALEHLRVYYVRQRDLARIQATVTSWFNTPPKIEWIQADLCRGDLLVEIEGRAACRT